jgi:deoxyribonuclease V
MLACVDVHYAGAGATAACVLFRSWLDGVECAHAIVHIDAVAPYRPGQFYRRELPCILRVLAQVDEQLDEQLEAIVVDGYVWLDEAKTPGLGAHLFLALGGAVAVIGVAKSSYRGSSHAIAVRRGTSARPVFVTAAGIDQAEAARIVAAMHGDHRVPTMLKRADALSRTR